MKHFKSTFLAVGSTLLVAAASATASAAARPRYGGTLRIETDVAIRTLDPGGQPADAGDAVARSRLLPLIFETLVTPDASGGLRPLLAVSWESDVRATRWRFRLRPGVKLHDGSTLDHLQVATGIGAKNTAWKVTAGDDGIVIESDHELPALPWELADIRYAVAIRRSTGELLGTGPFRVERREGGRLSLRAHEDHWAGRPFVDAVQIETGRSHADQLASLELGRTDIVTLRATDTRRVAQRGLRVVASRPLELLALVFEGPRTTPSNDQMRRALTLAIDRSAMCNVLLQRQGEPASTLLPQWLSGYASVIATSAASATSATSATSADRAASRDAGLVKTIISSLPAEQRALSLRVDATDAVAHAIGERIAVDAREAGLTVRLDPTGTLAPRPDVRLLRVRLAATSPERALDTLLKGLGPRLSALLTTEATPGAGAPLDAVYRFERVLIERRVIVPIVHLPELYGLGARVESWNGPPVLPSGSLDLASVWLP